MHEYCPMCSIRRWRLISDKGCEDRFFLELLQMRKTLLFAQRAGVNIVAFGDIFLCLKPELLKDLNPIERESSILTLGHIRMQIPVGKTGNTTAFVLMVLFTRIQSL